MLQRESGKASIVVSIDVDDEKSVVSIDTKGMSWDEIKKKLAATKEKEEAEAADNPAMAEAPKRTEKPKRGIEKLEKLPSVARVNRRWQDNRTH